jgi:GntR family uxuAB operon transcriptional repressor
MARPRKQDLPDKIRTFISDRGYAYNDRLPSEREFSAEIGVTRGELRRALAELEASGLIWRHVGRGTFIGARPVLNLEDVTYLGELASPTQVVAARLAIEPELARLASVNAAKANIDEIRTCAKRCLEAEDWREYEAWDNNFHHAVAKATHNKLLLYLFETLNVVRRATVWGQLRSTQLPERNHRSFREHEAIFAAIADRDPTSAATAMRDHLISVRDRILPMSND